MKYLIVSADDFGLSESIDNGILKACEEGIVTSVHVIPSGAAYFGAAASLKTAALKEIGAHLALTETAPVTELSRIPTLVGPDGNFHKSYTGLFAHLLLKRIDRAQIYLELKNQLDRLKATGIPITNLSSHQHVHIFPDILEIFIRLAKEYGIPSIRYLGKDKFLPPFRISKVYKKIILGYFNPKDKRLLEESGLSYTDNFLGFLDSGQINEDILIRMLNKLPDGTTELVTHPGFISAEVLYKCVFHKNCETDLAALTSRRVKQAIADKGIKLIPFSSSYRASTTRSR